MKVSEVAPTYRLAGERIIGDSLDFGYISSVFVLGDYLIATDRYLSPHVVVIDRSTGSILHRLGEHGEGSRQFSDPAWVTRDPNVPGDAWVFDYKSNSMSRLRIGARGPRIVDRMVLNAPVSLFEPVRVMNGWIANGVFPDETLLRLGTSGAPVRWLLAGPPFTADQVPHRSGRARLNRTRLAIDPSGARIALAYQAVPRVDIYTADGDYELSITGPVQAEAKFSLDADTSGKLLFSWNPDNEMAYVGVAATAGHIFSLFCGACLVDDQLANEVHVYSWAGDLVAMLHLDRSVLGIAVSEDGRTLYGGLDQPFPSIGVWRVPSFSNM